MFSRLLFASLLLLTGPLSQMNVAVAEEEPPTFERDIRPIFRAHCFDCHGASEESTKGGLDLRLKRFALEGGESGAALEPGDPDSSYLLMRIESGEMPPGDAHVSQDEIDTLRKWIAAGALTARPEPEEIPEGIGIAPEDREHWSFQPIERPATPALDQLSAPEQVQTDIDALLMASMTPKGLTFSDIARKETLIRRVALDLTGLQPTEAELNQFLNDESPEAYEQMVERYLATPHYGERWGRHWLDVAGYADSDGMTEQDRVRPFAYKYRDYIIKSFNENKPFDELVVEQLAGDEFVPSPYQNLTGEQQDLLAATGFLRMAADGTNIGGFNTEEHRNIVMADTIKIMSTSLIGLSVGCAQCHDHRYDPISQKDYYRFRAILEPALNRENWRTPDQRLVSLYTDEQIQAAADIEKQAQELTVQRNAKQKEYMDAALEKELLNHPEELREKLKTIYYKPAGERTEEEVAFYKKYPSVNISPGNLYQYNTEAAEDLKKQAAEIETVRAKKPFQDFVPVLNEIAGQIPKTHVFHRGEPTQPTDEVQPAALAISVTDGGAVNISPNEESRPMTGRRLAYAKWLTSGKHPLVARVMVNRIWMHHFGRPIVATPGDFGRLGVAPDHPELLDWLADEFMQTGWDIKQMHRLIMTSTVYKQSSQSHNKGIEKDPENFHYWKKPLYRLDAEAIRDSMLASAGSFNRRMYGEPIPVKENDVGQIVLGVDKKAPSNRPGEDVPLYGEEFRRSVYVQAIRSKPHTMLRTFDAPQIVVNCEKRTVSTVAPQALLMMNSDFSLETSTIMAEQLLAEFPQNSKMQIQEAWKRSMSETMDAETEATALAFLEQQQAWLTEHPPENQDPNHPYETPEKQALIDFCQAIFSSNGFMYVD
ncbi:Planctomycete cytochrome C [Polystyrenella longa]|uniref:Planctomycete cytochrome C n=2 Tax=Polystyrenella longa TaxID=2528007 RepID=A0A518CR41_9PLAN|nr:Planctomycete cytochrome C [Polystyrenella longa]